jgi:hypothetical protein
MDIEEAFDKLWQYGSELMVSMCNGDIKIFAKWFYDAGYKAGAEAMEKELACCGACKHWLVGDPNLIYDCDLWPQEGTALPVPDPYKVCPHFTPRKGGR